jgi:hypothetical protein
MALEPTVAAPPSTQTVASQFLASMAALSGVLTDYNSGSQVRTIAESLGSVVEQQSIWTQAEAFQALAYGAMTVLGITPYAAFPSVGQLTFATAPGSPYPTATQNVNIPAGTLAQTTGGVQFVTTANAVLASGTTSIVIPATAVLGGVAGNVPAGAVTQIVTGLLYPLFVTNAAAFTGGTNAEQLAATLARFSSAVAAIGLASPVAIANAAIGVTNPATSEEVLFSTLYEPFVAAGSGAGSGVAGWTLYIDNGTGAASSGLINNVISKLNGNAASGQVGYRDAGVPYIVSGVTPTYAVVGVSGTASSLTTDAALQTLINQAVSGYFMLPFGASAQQAVLAQNVGNAVLGLMTSLTVSLYASGSGSPLTALTPAVTGRVVLGQINYALN